MEYGALYTPNPTCSIGYFGGFAYPNLGSAWYWGPKYLYGHVKKSEKTETNRKRNQRTTNTRTKTARGPYYKFYRCARWKGISPFADLLYLYHIYFSYASYSIRFCPTIAFG